MTNKDFYAYCPDHRKTETDPNKQQVLTDVYNYLRECGTTKAGVKQCVDHMIYQKSNEPAKVEAYQWLLVSSMVLLSLWCLMVRCSFFDR
jgi:hypothetical protein